jgi:predicted adenine nucleotide alpha hydrolase (AANH) superfamily ATPase
LLVHICCSVDSHYFLQKIQEEFPGETLVGFFYDPNIQPYNEYRLRYLDVEYSCRRLGITLLEGAYNLEQWLEKVKGLEQEPEKGDRCTVCFDDRLETSVKKAIELGHDKFTTTLLISPKKSQDKLEKIGAELSLQYDCEFIFRDYRSGSGTQIQGQLVKENSLYRQNYCGCLFGLLQQRESQDKLMDEMFSPISNQILPESIESRLELYKRRDELETQNIPYKIIKQRFLNYRLLSGLTKINKKITPSYFLCYSSLNRRKMKGRIEYEKNEISYLNRDEVKILSINMFNEIGNSTYQNVKDLMFNPPTFESELNIRNKITNNQYGLSTIVVVDTVIDGKYEIELNALTYEDVMEVII